LIGQCTSKQTLFSKKQASHPCQAFNVEPSGVQALKNPNPLKDVEVLALLAVAELS